MKIVVKRRILVILCAVLIGVPSSVLQSHASAPAQSSVPTQTPAQSSAPAQTPASTSSASGQACGTPLKTDGTTCGLIAKACNSQNIKVSDLISSIIPPLESLMNAIAPVKKWLQGATVYNFTMGQEAVQSCSTFGYMVSAQGGTQKGQFRGFEVGRTVTAISGEAHIDNVPVEIKVRMDATTLSQNSFGMGGGNVSLLVGLPKIDEKIKFSSISPLFKAFDDLEVEDACVVFSTRDYQEEEWNTFVQQGVTLLIKLDVTKGSLGKLVKATGYTEPTIILKGFLSTGIVGSYFSVEIDKKIKLGKLGTTNGMLRFSLYFEQLVPGAPIPSVAIGIACGFTATLPKCTKAVDFMGEIRLNVITSQVTLTFWMDGLINFDKVSVLKPFEIGDIVLAVGVNLDEAAASGGLLALTEVFLGGTVAIESKELRLYGGINIAADEPEFILDVEFVGGLTLRDIVTLGCDAINKAGHGHTNCTDIANKVPELGLKTLQGYVCTLTTTYAGRTYREGFEINVAVDIFGTTAGIDISLMPTQAKVSGIGYISKFHLGPIYVTGRGPDMQWNTPDDGPIIRLEVDPKKPPFFSFFVSGLVDVRIKSLELLRASLDIFIAVTGFAFEMDCKIWDIFEAYVIANLMFIPTHEWAPAISKTGEKIATTATGMGAKVVGEKGAARFAAVSEEAAAKQRVTAAEETLKGRHTEISVIPVPGLPSITLEKGLEKKLTQLTKQYDRSIEQYHSEIDAEVKKGATEEQALETVRTRHPELQAAYQNIEATKAKIEAAQKVLKEAEEKAAQASEKAKQLTTPGERRFGPKAPKPAPAAEEPEPVEIPTPTPMAIPALPQI